MVGDTVGASVGATVGAGLGATTSCASCVDYDTPSDCYYVKDPNVDPNQWWASAESCIQTCFATECVPLDCRYLSPLQYTNVFRLFGLCENWYGTTPDPVTGAPLI